VTVTDRRVGGQCDDVGPPTPAAAAETPALPPDLDAVYRAHADFVHRTACQLGVPSGQVEDVMHDVFLVVHRRLVEYDGRSMRSWLYGITRRVVLHQRRGDARRDRRTALAVVPTAAPDPERDIAAAQVIEQVERFLATLDDDQRIVFVLADIEGTPIPEIAAALGVNLNTVYSRLRLARRRFERAIENGEVTRG
jgi:RNA polymerase sigma-70 factor (ECF subfamily)